MRTLTIPAINATVGEVGYGLMGLTWRPDPLSEEHAFKAMKTALAQGCNLWNGGEFYGPPEHNSLTLLNTYFTKYPEDADKIVLTIKGCVSGNDPDSSPTGIRASLERCLAQLPPSVKTIDIFEPARLTPGFPIEDTAAAFAELIREGKIKGYSLSEVRGETIRRAHKVHPVSVVEVELSLWATEPLEKQNEAAEACAELGVPMVAYSPIGQGMLSGDIKSLDDLPPDDMRRHFPRFTPEIFPLNLKLVDEVQKLATKKQVTGAQVAIAWVLARPHHFKFAGQLTVIPIPGSTSEKRILENAGACEVEWTEEDEREVGRILSEVEVVGMRYPEVSMKYCSQ